MVQSEQRGGIVTPEGGDLVLIDSVEPELVSQLVGNANEPAETVGQGAVEIEDDQLESQGRVSVGGGEARGAKSGRQAEDVSINRREKRFSSRT